MKQQLYNALNSICPNNVFLQGTLEDSSAYPESFITYFTTDTADNAHYNNDVHSIDWHFTVIYYSSDPSTISTKANQIRTALKSAGFIPQGKGFDIPSDVPTHTGWVMEFIKTEFLN